MEETIGDKLAGVWRNYFAISKSDSPKSQKEKTLLNSGEYGEEYKYQGYDKLSPTRRRQIAQESPILMKGVRKKSLDTFRAWFLVEALDGHGSPVAADIQAFTDFEKRSDFRAKCVLAKVGSHVYGNGYILITFTADKGVPLSQPPSEKSEPFTASLINPEYINSTTPSGDFVFSKHDGTEDKVIHKDRIIHFKANALPGYNLGTSTIDVLRWTLFSKKNIDIAAGHILAWFSHGIIDYKRENMTAEELAAITKIAKTHPGTYIHDQDTEISVHNPTAIDPKPFYDYVVLNIAAALNMPTHVLTGIQTGRVTGSEIGFADYYRDIHDEQELEITPQLEYLYARILRARGRKWKYQLVWNPIYIDEMTEANLMEKRINAAEKALNGTKGIGGFIDTEEARTMFNKGQITIDPSKTVKPRPQPKPPEPSERDIKPPTPKRIPKENQAMIDRWKAMKKKELDEFEEKVDNA